VALRNVRRLVFRVLIEVSFTGMQRL
jgi:hypothetical protein